MEKNLSIFNSQKTKDRNHALKQKARISLNFKRLRKTEEEQFFEGLGIIVKVDLQTHFLFHSVRLMIFCPREPSVDFGNSCRLPLVSDRRLQCWPPTLPVSMWGPCGCAVLGRAGCASSQPASALFFLVVLCQVVGGSGRWLDFYLDFQTFGFSRLKFYLITSFCL